MNKERKQEIIDHMFKSACGYGMAERNGIQSKFDENGDYMPNKTGGTAKGGKRAFEECMNAIPEDLFGDFVYTLYRISDKSGADGFDY